jgi:hypothetical protein
MPIDEKPNPDDRPIWFPAKRYGWGWGLPIAWQGWVVMGVWAAVLASIGWFIMLRSAVGYVAFIIFMLAILIAICYAKGEPPRWRWGGK